MLRIVGIQKSEFASKEFVLLQNQGAMRIRLRGHALASECLIDTAANSLTHVFAEDELIPAGMYVLLVSGAGTPRWGRTKDGQLIFYAFMNRTLPVWIQCEGATHVLNIQHSFTARATAPDAVQLV